MNALLLVDAPAEGVVIVTLNHRDKANALDNALCQALSDTLTRLSQDPMIKVIILTHQGRVFCAGGDIKAMAQKKDMFAGSAESISLQYQSIIHPVQQILHQSEAIFIAAIDGAATGAGNDLVAHCDFALATPRARFAESFINLGLISGDGGLWILERKIGFAQAALMAYTGEWFEAKDALDMGLIYRIVEPEHLLEEALILAQRIAKHPKTALSATRRLLNQGLTQSFEEHLKTCADTQGPLHHSPEHEQLLTHIR